MSRPTGLLCVGLTTLDVVHHVSGPPRWGRKERTLGGELVAGGPAANAAVTSARLLPGVRLLTAIGTGPAAGPVRADLAAHSVRVVDLAPPDWPLPVASALVDPATGERTVVSPGALGAGGVSAGGRALDGLLDGVGLVLLDGHHPALAAEVAALAARARVPVLLDAGSWKDEVAELLPRVALAACSADFQPPGLRRAGDDPEGVATELHRRGVASVLVTDGPRPITWRTMDGQRGTVPVPSVRAVDTLGAGDVFHGALAAALVARGGSLAGCAGLAAEVAAARCAHLGSRDWLDTPELTALAARFAARSKGRPAGGSRGGSPGRRGGSVGRLASGAWRR
ncbi:PfkB family carbohydrate kinase [Pseudonocardia eucalypti]|uniref:PfkB family carbohydrate kinase n=1 Tax=Pseudonocardia eucalypti TaxID=648755 RepID=A0ABP9QSN1_9PSEU|nr:sugar/nucleoside kinase (ribokinase family) [Pseudonocardia eucalypti]